MSMYSMTHLTGRKRNEGRVTVIQGFEFQRKTLVVIGVSTGVGLIPAVILSLTISPFFMLLVPTLIVGVSYWAFVTRNRDGMKLSRYRSIVDKRSANLNEFHICFEPISDMPKSGIVNRQTVEVNHTNIEDEAPTVLSPPNRKTDRRKPRRVESVIVG